MSEWEWVSVGAFFARASTASLDIILGEKKNLLIFVKNMCELVTLRAQIQVSSIAIIIVLLMNIIHINSTVQAWNVNVFVKDLSSFPCLY